MHSPESVEHLPRFAGEIGAGQRKLHQQLGRPSG